MVGCLIASFSQRGAVVSGIKRKIITSAGNVLLAMADASQLVTHWCLHSPLLAALVAINQVRWEPRQQDIFGAAITNLAKSRPMI